MLLLSGLDFSACSEQATEKNLPPEKEEVLHTSAEKLPVFPESGAASTDYLSSEVSTSDEDENIDPSSSSVISAADCFETSERDAKLVDSSKPQVDIEQDKPAHRPHGNPDLKTELHTTDTYHLEEPNTKSSGNEKPLKEPLFEKPPVADHIYQDTSLDCGSLAPLASIVASNDGAEIIENMIFDDVEKGKVYIRFFIPTDYQNKKAEFIGKKKVIVELDKIWDNEWSWGWSSKLSIEKFTSRSKLWVHLMERAYSLAFQTFQTTRNSLAEILPSDTYQSILGSKVQTQIGSDTQAGRPPFRVPAQSGKFTINSLFLNRLAVVSRSEHAYATGRDKSYSGIYNQHYYAVVSRVCVYENQRGIWLFNTLNRDNTWSGLLFNRKYSRSFFLSLEETSDIFTSIGVTDIKF